MDFILNDFKRQDNKTYGLIRLPAAAHSLKIEEISLVNTEREQLNNNTSAEIISPHCVMVLFSFVQQ